MIWRPSNILNTTIDAKLDEEFRLMAAKRYGNKKGTLRMAIEAAMAYWIWALEEEDEEMIKMIDDIYKERIGEEATR